MRHGRSLANEEGIIISLIENGGDSYGLTKGGKEQVRSAIVDQTVLNSDTLIFSSDFLRAKETASLVGDILKTQTPQSSPLLRERYFGDFEKTDDSHYKKVWQEDIKNNDNTLMNVESPRAVLTRFKKFIQELEGLYDQKQILIVSHGDILQIGMTWPAGISPGQHRSLNHLETAEIRPLFSAADMAQFII